MALRPQRFSWIVCALSLCSACGSSSSGPDKNDDNVADDLGKVVDANNDGNADLIDINHDGKPDGFGVDTDKDGKADALALDTDCDGFFEATDTDGDGKPNFVSQKKPPGQPPAGCEPPNLNGGSGAGGSGSSGGSSAMSGSSSGGSPSMAGSGGSGDSGPSELGKGNYQGTGESSDQYAEADVARNGVGYKFIANGWGMGWKSHTISWNGTSFTVKSLNGSPGSDYSPAGYPTMYCGKYSKPPKQSDPCGLPAVLTSLQSARTGWRWNGHGDNGQYNAAWDIWLGDGSDNLSGYLMVWLRDPPGQVPAGSAGTAGIKVTNVPGSWNLWTGAVQGVPIVNYVRAEGQDLSELEFDVLDFYRDAKGRNLNLPGTKLLAVAVGFETWSSISNVSTEDFYVDVK